MSGFFQRIFAPKMPRKIAIVGPESTGKSTLTKELAAHYLCSFVPEYARTYLEQLGRPYEEKDLLQIAKGQVSQEQSLLVPGDNYLFCDTNLLTIQIWAEDKFGRCDPWILQNLSLETYALHLLTYPDLPWEPDPLREDANRLMELFEWYEAALQQAKVPYQVIRGVGKDRLENAIRTIES